MWDSLLFIPHNVQYKNIQSNSYFHQNYIPTYPSTSRNVCSSPLSWVRSVP